MALQCQNQDILSAGEWIMLCDGMAPGEGSPTLSAWAMGIPVPPDQLIAAFDIDARLAARTEDTHSIIATAVSRLERAFPKVALK